MMRGLHTGGKPTGKVGLLALQLWREGEHSLALYYWELSKLEALRCLRLLNEQTVS